MKLLNSMRSWSWRAEPPSYEAVAIEDDLAITDESAATIAQRQPGRPSAHTWIPPVQRSQSLWILWLSTLEKQWLLVNMLTIAASGLLGVSGAAVFATRDFDSFAEVKPSWIAGVLGMIGAVLSSTAFRTLRNAYNMSNDLVQTLEQQNTNRFISTVGFVLAQSLLAIFHIVYAITSPCVVECGGGFKGCRVPCSEASLAMNVLRYEAILETILLMMTCIYHIIKLVRTGRTQHVSIAFGDEDEEDDILDDRNPAGRSVRSPFPE